MNEKEKTEVTKEEAKEALDNIIKKSRVHLYKPIQIAEILYRYRTYKDINLSHLEDYRAKSKKWRDDICIELLGRICTSSSKFQDNLFDENAMPPRLLVELGKENTKTSGAVEAYIYKQFLYRHNQLSEALSYCRNASKDTFDVKHLIDSFWNQAGLKRSIDKVYEIIVYSLFSTLINAMDMHVEISVSEKGLSLLSEFEDFTRKVMCIDSSKYSYVQDVHVYRVGVTNAADRGLDMYSNWGPAIQIKHLSLTTKLAENIVESVSSDKVIIVCQKAEKEIIVSLLTQIGWRSHIQSVITEDDLIDWYEKALRGKYSEVLGDNLLSTLCEEIMEEFPALFNIPEALKNRHYEKLEDDFWK